MEYLYKFNRKVKDFNGSLERYVYVYDTDKLCLISVPLEELLDNVDRTKIAPYKNTVLKDNKVLKIEELPTLTKEKQVNDLYYNAYWVEGKGDKKNWHCLDIMYKGNLYHLKSGRSLYKAVNDLNETTTFSINGNRISTGNLRSYYASYGTLSPYLNGENYIGEFKGVALFVDGSSTFIFLIIGIDLYLLLLNDYKTLPRGFYACYKRRDIGGEARPFYTDTSEITTPLKNVILTRDFYLSDVEWNKYQFESVDDYTKTWLFDRDFV